MFLPYLLQQNITASNSGCCHKCSCLYAVGNDIVCGAMKPFLPLNDNGICAVPSNFRPHFSQKIRQITYFRLCCRILNGGSAFCKRCCHHNIFCCTHTWKIQIDPFATQAVFCRKLHYPMLQFMDCPHNGKSFQMQIHRSAANGTAAGQRQRRLMTSC